MTEKTYPVRHMTCASCAAHVEKAARSQAGVESAAVNLPLEKLTLQVDAQRFEQNQLKQAISDVGYELVTPSASKELVFNIQGMTCASCAAHVEKAARSQTGVESAAVNLPLEKLTLQVDAQRFEQEQLKRAISDAGYEVNSSFVSEELTLGINGMTCASCAANVEKAISRVPGVQSVAVNLTTARAQIQFDSAAASPQAIRAAVTKSGYEPVSQAPTSSRSDPAAKMADRAHRNLRLRLWLAIAFALPMTYLAMGHMLPWGLSLPVPAFIDHHANPLGFALAQFLLTTPIIIAGSRFYTVGFRLLWKRSPNMDSLVALGTGSAWLYGVYALIRIATGETAYVDSLYFETAAIVVTLVMVGKYMETISKKKTSEALRRLMEMQPDTALLIRDGKTVQVSLSDVDVGDRLLVRPGDSVPLDGAIEKGLSAIDESMLTGESLPVDKQPGDTVVGGSINKEGSLEITVTRVGADTTLARIIKMVEDAQSRKAPIAKTADIVALYFVPTVLAIAVLAAIAWTIAGQPFDFVLRVFVTILVIACPCALGLATPTAIMVGTGKGAQMGILIKSGEALETTHAVDTVLLDKTGTITEGAPVLTDIFPLQGGDESKLLALAASAERDSEHPVAQAIVDAAEKKNLSLPETDHFKAIPGRGIEASSDGQKLWIGNQKFMEEHQVDIAASLDRIEQWSHQGKTVMYMAIDGQLTALFAAADTIKATSQAAVRRMRSLGIEAIMVTGDNASTAKAIAKEAGIRQVLSDILPEDKAAEVKKLQDKGRLVAMVGDGINDAPALVQADVGMAIGTGADVAVDSADVVLVKGDLNTVPTAIALSRATIRNIRQNLFWAFVYNTAGIPIAAGLLYVFGGPLLSPIFAGAAMALSSVSVVTNALRLKRFRIR